MKYFADGSGFRPWQPSSWPEFNNWDSELLEGIGRIFRETIVLELGNVIADAQRQNPGGLIHRGHVVAIGLLCAIDAISSYGYQARIASCYTRLSGESNDGFKYRVFIQEHFPSEYRPHARDIYELYRNSAVHHWNLFEVTLLPGNDGIQQANGTLIVGLVNFFDALKVAIEDFLRKLASDSLLQFNVLDHYTRMRRRAVP